MSRRYLIILAGGLGLSVVLAFVVLPRPRAHAQGRLQSMAPVADPRSAD